MREMSSDWLSPSCIRQDGRETG